MYSQLSLDGSDISTSSIELQSVSRFSDAFLPISYANTANASDVHVLSIKRISRKRSSPFKRFHDNDALVVSRSSSMSEQTRQDNSDVTAPATILTAERTSSAASITSPIPLHPPPVPSRPAKRRIVPTLIQERSHLTAVNAVVRAPSLNVQQLLQQEVALPPATDLKLPPPIIPPPMPSSLPPPVTTTQKVRQKKVRTAPPTSDGPAKRTRKNAASKSAGETTSDADTIQPPAAPRGRRSLPRATGRQSIAHFFSKTPLTHSHYHHSIASLQLQPTLPTITEVKPIITPTSIIKTETHMTA